MLRPTGPLHPYRAQWKAAGLMGVSWVSVLALGDQAATLGVLSEAKAL